MSASRFFSASFFACDLRLKMVVVLAVYLCYLSRIVGFTYMYEAEFRVHTFLGSLSSSRAKCRISAY